MKITLDADEIAEIVEAYVRDKIARPGSEITVSGPGYSDPTVKVSIKPPGPYSGAVQA